MAEVMEQRSSKDDVSDEFKQQVEKCDTAGIFDEILGEIIKVVVADEEFRQKNN